MPTPRPSRLARALALAVVCAACAETTEPLPPPQEVLLVLDGAAAELEVIPVRSPATRRTLPLGVSGAGPTAVAADGAVAVVSLRAANAIAVVDLRGEEPVRFFELPTNSGAGGAAVLGDTLAYVANPNLSTVTRFDLRTGDTASVAVGTTPREVVFTRGRVFVLNANVGPGGESLGESWISVIDPVTNAPATGVDSIGLPGTGEAADADVGVEDGMLYAVSAGATELDDGRLSIVDPVARREVANFSGVGPSPAGLASGGDEQLFISSPAEGLLVFDTESRTFLRSTDDPIAVPARVGVEVDSRGQLYAADDAACGGEAGVLRILRKDWSEAEQLPLGTCPIATAISNVPPAP